jgi:hypothetical protein
MTDPIVRAPSDTIPGFLWGGLYARPFSFSLSMPLEAVVDALYELEIPREGYFQMITRKVEITVDDFDTTRFTAHEMRRNRGVDYDSAVAFGTLKATGGKTTDVSGYVRYGFSHLFITWLPPIVFLPVLATVMFVLSEDGFTLWWIPVVTTITFAIAMYIVWFVVDRDRKRLLAALESLKDTNA